MKDFLGQVTCGGFPVAVLFGTLYAVFANIDTSAAFWLKQVGAFEALDYVLVILMFLAVTIYIFFVIAVTSVLWLRAAASVVGPEEAKRIYHRTYRTPGHGFSRHWNVGL